METVGEKERERERIRDREMERVTERERPGGPSILGYLYKKI